MAEQDRNYQQYTSIYAMQCTECFKSIISLNLYNNIFIDPWSKASKWKTHDLNSGLQLQSQSVLGLFI